MALANSLTKKAPYKGLKPASLMQHEMLAAMTLRKAYLALTRRRSSSPWS